MPLFLSSHLFMAVTVAGAATVATNSLPLATTILGALTLLALASCCLFDWTGCTEANIM